MNNNKGFTILELLIVIFIIGLIPLIFVNSFGKTKVNIDEERGQTGTTLLDDAVEVFYYLGMKEGTLEYFTKEDGSVISCISVNSLVSNGYILEENHDLSKYALLSVKDGELSYELTTNTSLCEYEKISLSGIYDGESSSTSGGDDEVDSYTFKQNVSTIDVNTFAVDIDFSFKALLEIATVDPSAYILIMLDRSGSMMGSGRMSAANSAISALSTTLAQSEYDEYDICIGFVSYGWDVTLDQPFTNRPFVAKAVAYGDENYTHAFEFAYELFTSPDSRLPISYTYSPNSWGPAGPVTSTLKTPTHSVPECAKRLTTTTKIVLFISDGNPIMLHTQQTMYAAATKVKNAGIAVYTFGYEINSTILRTLASQTCGTNKNEPCYSTSGISVFATQLKDFLINTINEINESKYKTAKVEMKLNSTYFTYDQSDGSSPSHNNGTVTIDIDLSKYDSTSGTFVDDYGFNIKYNGKGFGDGVNSIQVNIFDEVNIIFYDAEGNASKTEKLANLPKITLNKYNSSAIN